MNLFPFFSNYFQSFCRNKLGFQETDATVLQEQMTKITHAVLE